MRFVVFGAGAVGGVVGARLHQGGHQVSLIARGAHLDAIRERGLTVVDPSGSTALEIEAFGSPAELHWEGDEVVALTMKGQDTAAALGLLRAAVPPRTPVVCMQNGVDNERRALRLFENVYGAVVMLPAAHIEPGVVESHASRLTGIIDVGRYPSGADRAAETIAAALRESRFDSCARDDIMRLKYAKLILNLANAVGAICAPGPDNQRVTEAARDEGIAALTAADISFDAPEVTDVEGRWERMGVQTDRRAGSSTWQSLARHAGEVETDYLNGEIALLGRLYGVATPVNAALSRLAARVAAAGEGPQTLTARDVLAEAELEDVAWTR
jgi:2-dehydropantoate 2-reductase